jgi:flagellar biogenesis protein FliO
VKATFRIFFLLFCASVGGPLLCSAAETAAPATPGYLSEELGQVSSAAPVAQSVAPSLLPTLLNVVFSLAFVVGLIYLAYWLLLRWRNSQGLSASAQRVGLIRVLEKISIDASHGLAVVEVGGEVLYLGLGADVSLLGKVSDPQEVERLREQAPLPASFLGFQEQFSRVGAKLKQEEWASTKKSLKTQADDLKQQIERLRNPRRGQDD